uniref:Amino acid transporter n=1 Tax=Strix occidentalis caurina TaxID=311401 RepID=A0A8D0FYC5_STROC
MAAWERGGRASLSSLSATFLRVWKWVRAFWCKNGLLTLSMLSVATGCLLGFLLRALELTELEKQYFSFPGELLMRMLKMLILPLITSSLMSGLATMDSKACGKMGVITITYYLWTTFMAVTVGIILVVSIHPGAAAQKDNYSVGKVMLSSADALLDLIRNMFPSNLIEASFQQVSSPGSTTAGGGDGAPRLPSAHPRAGTQTWEGAGGGRDSQGPPHLPSAWEGSCTKAAQHLFMVGRGVGRQQAWGGNA